MAIGEESGWSNDDTATGNDRPPAGGKRRMIREGGSAYRVSIKARPRDPGGGTVSTDPRRRIVLYDVIVSVEQPREEPTLISHTDSTAQTGQDLAEDTHIQECSHDVVGLYAHKGTMWITDDRVSQKNIKLPCGGGVLTLPGAAGGFLPAMFPASALPIDEPQLDSWQVIVVRVDETPARDSSEQEPPCDSQYGRRPMDMNNSLNILVHTVVQGGPVGPQEKERLALLVLDHADPVGWYAVVQKKLLGPAGPKVIEPLALLALIHADPAGQRAAVHRAVSLRECLPAQPEPPDGDGLVKVNSDKEPMVRQVPDLALDSQLMEGITYIEVSLDSRPMEGLSCQEQVEQSILLASWTVSHRDCVMETKLEWEPVITPAYIYDLDSRPMEGTTYLEHPAPAVYLDSWPMEGEARSRKLYCEPMIIPAINHNLDSRPMEGTTYLEHSAPAVYLDSWPMEGEVRKKKLECESVITPADSHTPDSRPMEGMTYLEHPAPAVYLDSWLVRGASYPRPHVNWEVWNSKPSVYNVTIVKMVDTDASDDVNTHLPDKVTTPMTAPAWPCADSSRLPTVKLSTE